jgi:hypothetical protein
MALHLFRLPTAFYALQQNLSLGGHLVVVTKTEEQRLAHPMSAFFQPKGASNALVCANDASALLTANGFCLHHLTCVNQPVRLRVDEIPIVFGRNANSFLRRQSAQQLRAFHHHLKSRASRGFITFITGYTLLFCKKD